MPLSSFSKTTTVLILSGLTWIPVAYSLPFSPPKATEKAQTKEIPLSSSSTEVPLRSPEMQPTLTPPTTESRPLFKPIAVPTFFCGESQGYPATLAKTERGNITVIRWVSDYFTASGWSPEARCTEVSRRFQAYSQNGSLQFVTTGYMNRQPVICVAQEMYGRCLGLLLTLKPGSNPIATLQKLMNVSTFGSAPLNESASPNLYINMKDFLKKAPLNP